MNLTLHVVTPLHVGAGQDIGGVALPVARQKPTGFPYIPGSTVKGCLRARLGDDEAAATLFGSEPEKDLDAGDVFFGDAQLVVMPVRDGALTFVWLTCPTLLRQGRRIGLKGEPQGKPRSRVLDGSVSLGSVQDVSDDLKAWVTLATGHDRDFVNKRVFCVSDEEFRWAAEFATQIDVRNRIDLETGVVRDHALWSEESLAPETLLVAPVRARNKDASNALEAIAKVQVVTFGGKNTVGRGVCRLALHGETRP